MEAKKSVTRNLASLAAATFLVCLVLLPVPGGAESYQEWLFTIDCYANGGDVNNADTSDKLTVKFFNDGEEVTATIHRSDWDRSCGEFSDMSYDVTYQAGQTIDEVRVYTPGDDALWMDQVALYYYSGAHQEKADKWGTDNTKGWCLSTDWNDWDGNWSNNVPSEHCRSCYRFIVGESGGFSCPDVHDDEN